MEKMLKTLTISWIAVIVFASLTIGFLNIQSYNLAIVFGILFIISAIAAFISSTGYFWGTNIKVAKNVAKMNSRDRLKAVIAIILMIVLGLVLWYFVNYILLR